MGKIKDFAPSGGNMNDPQIPYSGNLTSVSLVGLIHQQAA
jgi:hypothetical protein